MKRGLLFTVLVAFCTCVQAQSPVTWKYSAVKLGEKTYEIKLAAAIQPGWHLYSQTTPDGGPLPTKINFNKNPLLTLTGAIKEIGKLVSKHEEVFDIVTKYYSDRVEFAQTVTLKSRAKTNVTGTLEFMVCNDTQCLPPSTLSFSIAIDN
jgi:hypothetical protein